MDANKGNIYQIFNGFKQFIIPVYQRMYSWEHEHCQRLWRDIVAMQQTGRAGHFVGSIVNIAEQAMPTGVQKFMIIDGQQRMTTLTLLLIALRDYAQNHPDTVGINAPMITSMLLKNDFQNGDERYKLLLTQTDRDVLIKLVEGIPIDSGKPSRLTDNYAYFVEQIEKMELSPADIYQSIGKLQIVNITLDRQVDDPQAIFESLNSTGMDLSESDLIRNHILMGLEANEQTHIYETLWRPTELLFDYERQSQLMDRFFRDYITMKIGRIPNVNRVYEEFKRYHINSEFATIEELCQDIYTFSKYYTNMYFCRNDDKTLAGLYEDIKAMQMEVSFPFLLKVHHDHACGIIPADTLAEIIKLCISYVLRRNVCDIPTNSLNKTFATMKNDIKHDDYLNSVKAFFILRETYKEFPNDAKFLAAFASRDMYNIRIRNFVLSRLENHNNKAPIIIENFTIEHIMPQNPKLSEPWIAALGEEWKDVQKKYLHTIGNLTLTAYNSEMSDSSFEEKLNMEGGFKQSALRLNGYVVIQTTWDEGRITERAQLLAEQALKIWAYPQLTETELAPYITPIPLTTQYSLESYEQLNAYNRMLFEKLNTRILNLSPAVKREFKKLYIAYKIDTNFVDVVIQKNRLRISLNMKFSEIIDIKGICRDITGLGRWGNGDVEVFLESLAQLDDVMEIVEQAYQSQTDC